MATPHDPHHAHHDDDPAYLLAVPGGPRPTIWRVAAGRRPGGLTPQSARGLLDAYTRPGDVVIDVDDDVAVAAAAAQTGRRHHALGGNTRLATLGNAASSIDLVLLHWPRRHVNPRWLLVACRSLLRPSGRLVITVTVPAEQRAPHLSALAGAAHTAGMDHVAHIVEATVSHVDRRSHSTDADSRPDARGGEEPDGDAISNADSAGQGGERYRDLLVFALAPAGHG